MTDQEGEDTVSKSKDVRVKWHSFDGGPSVEWKWPTDAPAPFNNPHRRKGER